MESRHDSLLQWQQIEHISSLQELARSAIDSIPDMSDVNNPSELDSSLFKLWQHFQRLTRDARWPSLLAHIDDSARELELMTFQLEPGWLVPPWEKGESVESYQKQLIQAEQLLHSSDLWLVANSGDTREWEYYGLNLEVPMVSQSNM